MGVDRSPRIATLQAETEVTALELTRDVFMRLVGASSPLAYRFQMELAVATGRQLREANRRLLALFEARERRATHAASERAVHQQLEDVVGDLDLAFEPFDVIEITPQERVVGHRVADLS